MNYFISFLLSLFPPLQVSLQSTLVCNLKDCNVWLAKQFVIVLFSHTFVAHVYIYIYMKDIVMVVDISIITVYNFFKKK